VDLTSEVEAQYQHSALDDSPQVRSKAAISGYGQMILSWTSSFEFVNEMGDVSGAVPFSTQARNCAKRDVGCPPRPPKQ
jgi:hypothetical protein